MSVKVTTINYRAQPSLPRPSARWLGATRVVALVLAVVLASLIVARVAGAARADRGGVPASAATIEPGAQLSGAVHGATYVVRPGDTLWALAERFHGQTALEWYVDELVELNGSASIAAGQQILLP